MKAIYNRVSAVGIAIGICMAPAALAEPPSQQWQTPIVVESEDFTQLAEAAIDAGDYRNAIFHANRAIDLEPTSAIAYLLRGQANGYLGDRQAAIADLERAASIYNRQDNVIGSLLVRKYLQDLRPSHSSQAFGTLPQI